MLLRLFDNNTALQADLMFLFALPLAVNSFLCVFLRCLLDRNSLLLLKPETGKG